jgi:hypothetical protein
MLLSKPAILDGGTLGTAGLFVFAAGVTLNASQLGIGGTVAFLNQPFMLTAATQIMLANNSLLQISGGIAGGQSIDVTGTPSRGHSCTLELSGAIGTTTVTADKGSVVELSDGFMGTRPTAENGGKVIPPA